jgi:hypothetical protein
VTLDAPESVWTRLQADPRRFGLLLGLAVFLVALVLRAIGIGWGLPTDERHWSLHPDEPVVWLYAQQIDPASGDFTPGFYNYGTLYLTMMSVTTRVVTAYGGGSREADRSDKHLAVGRFHLAGRWLSALAGAGLAWVVFLILYRRVHWVGAATAGAVVAFAPGMVVHSRFQTVDMVATFFLGLSLLWACRMADEGACTRTAALAGLFAGLSAGTKYTGVLALIVLVVVAALARPVRWREALVGVGAGLAAFAATTPGMVLEPSAFWRDFRYEMAHTATGHGLVFAAALPGFMEHALNLAVGVGGVLVAIGAVGLGRAAYRKHAWAIGLLAFAVVYSVLIGRAEVRFLRYTFPLVPVLAVGVGWLVARAHENPNPRWRILNVAAFLALGGFPNGGLALATQATQAMAGEDPRDVAGRWFKSEGKGKTVGLVSDPWFYTPTLYPEAAAARFVPADARLEAMSLASDPRVVQVTEEPKRDFDERLPALVRPDYIVVSSFEVEGLAELVDAPTVPLAYRAQVDQYRQFMKLLDQDYERHRVFPPEAEYVVSPLTRIHDLMYVRPVLWVWKRRDGSPTTSSGSSTGSSSNAAPAR